MKDVQDFQIEWRVLLAVTISGLIYNLGLLAGPWFEGKMTGCLVDILKGTKQSGVMLYLVTDYVAVIAVVAGPAILLLDEITANLDAETEQNVLMALKKVSKDRTDIYFTQNDCFDGTYDFYIIVCNRTDKPDKREECRGK